MDRASGAQVRYFSPLAEVPFCGHATIATAVAHAERHGAGRLDLVTRGDWCRFTPVTRTVGWWPR